MATKNKARQAVDDLYNELLASARRAKPRKAKKPKRKVITRTRYVNVATGKQIKKPRKSPKPRKASKTTKPRKTSKPRKAKPARK